MEIKLIKIPNGILTPSQKYAVSYIASNSHRIYT